MMYLPTKILLSVAFSTFFGVTAAFAQEAYYGLENQISNTQLATLRQKVEVELPNSFLSVPNNKDYYGVTYSQTFLNSQTLVENEITKRNEQIAREYFDQVWNKGNLMLLDQLLAENYTIEKPIPGFERFDFESKKSLLSEFLRAFPDARVKIKELRANADSVLVRTHITGTHQGVFQGIKPTGKRIKVDQVQLKRFNNGRIVFHTQVLDDQQLIAQLNENIN